MIPSLIERPDYVVPFSFESYNYSFWYKWMENNWQISIYSAAVYLVLIYFGQKLMERRKPFGLRRFLTLWNAFLCIGSLAVVVRGYPEVSRDILNNGVYNSFCSSNDRTVIASFWSLVFTFSKILEFGDTAFIILRKQKLIFLHYYHHVTVTIYTFYSFSDNDPAGRIVGFVNAIVHFFMYGYYCSRASGYKVHSKIAMSVTVIQIAQMYIGLIINIWGMAGKLGWTEVDCNRSWNNIFWALLMYSSYLVLFVKFFVKSYYPLKNFEIRNVSKTK